MLSAYGGAVLLAVFSAVGAPLVAWKYGTRNLRWIWFGAAPLVPLGFYFASKMPSEGYDYTGARGVFTVIVGTFLFCSTLIGLSWTAGRFFRRALK